MRLGIFSKAFPGGDLNTVFKSVRECGYTATQFNLASAGIAPLPKEIPGRIVEAIRGAGERHGVEVAALSATFNMIHPDEKIIQDGLHSLAVLASAASRMGCPLLTLCTGTMDRENQWRHHPDNDTPAAWDKLLETMGKAVKIAEDNGVFLGIEPEFANVVSSADRAKKLLDAMGGRIRVIFDAANLFEQVSSPDEQHRIIDNALSLLGPYIAIAHAKDRLVDGSFAVAGQGVLDYPYYVKGLRKSGFSGCLVTHGLAAADAKTVAIFLRDALAAGGL
jgi:Sugar phosphate isomerases/epimerases